MKLGPQNRTIAELLTAQAHAVPDRAYLLFEDDTFTYADVERVTNALAAGLRGVGIAAGQHVGMLMDNCPEFLWVAYALGKLGAVAVPFNTAVKGRQLRYFVEDSDCTAIVLDSHYLPLLDEERLALGTVIVRPTGDPSATSARGHRLDELVEAGESSRETPPPVSAAYCDPWFIMYTSGTTGPSKGVVCPHAHPITVADEVTRALELTLDDRMYTFLPLYHGNALWYSSLTALWAGASIALAPRFSASRFWNDVHRYGATEFNAIMSVATILEKADPVPDERDNPLRLAFVVPLPVAREELEARWGVEFVCNYSMTEIFPAAVLRPGEGRSRGPTSGRVVDDRLEVRIVDDLDCEVPPGTPGEVVVRPRDPWTTFTEYYGKPQATAENFRNLWFHTGDRAYVDADGWFYFVDRKKDAIRRRGENISAHEIELILEGHPGIAEAAAVPTPSELGEDEVAVYVVRADPGLTERGVIEYAMANMAYFMVPRYVAFIDEVPKTTTHKKAKYTLRDRAQQEYQDMWDRERHGIEVRRPDVQAMSR